MIRFSVCSCRGPCKGHGHRTNHALQISRLQFYSLGAQLDESSAIGPMQIWPARTWANLHFCEPLVVAKPYVGQPSLSQSLPLANPQFSQPSFWPTLTFWPALSLASHHFGQHSLWPTLILHGQSSLWPFPILANPHFGQPSFCPTLTLANSLRKNMSLLWLWRGGYIYVASCSTMMQQSLW